jgi:hypothetical protein
VANKYYKDTSPERVEKYFKNSSDSNYHTLKTPSAASVAVTRGEDPDDDTRGLALNEAFVTEVLPLLESANSVERHAWFSTRNVDFGGYVGKSALLPSTGAGGWTKTKRTFCKNPQDRQNLQAAAKLLAGATKLTQVHCQQAAVDSLASNPNLCYGSNLNNGNTYPIVGFNPDLEACYCQKKAAGAICEKQQEVDSATIKWSMYQVFATDSTPTSIGARYKDFADSTKPPIW